MKAKSTTTLACGQCGSPLVLITQTTEQFEGQRSPMTISTYRCSNADCQARIDKDTAERKKNFQKREAERIAREERNTLRLKKR